ncbi:MBL fold metallo-hydrolase [Nocardia sp. R7R-8]|uniref:MBL fold metallo-hydrolase n=1 Tax=Nocardia sp. R7R-8 TaxID=3459304 RepID=UPI00403D930A
MPKRIESDSVPQEGVSAMLVRHLDCATMCPAGGRALLGSGGLLTGGLVGHCLLVESDDGLVLVDTGFGMADVLDRGRLGFATSRLLRPRLRPERTALHQIRGLGYRREDVRHIVLTHLDLDHAGGLSDFPDATVHVFADELDAATQRPTLGAKLRYRPRQWEHAPRWLAHETGADTWFGFTAVPVLEDIMLIPLVGHTRGHSGVAVRQSDGWLLHCGDAYFHHRQLAAGKARPPVGLGVFEVLASTLGRERVANLQRLRTLHADHGDRVRMFCAHDPHELDRFAAVPVR